MRYTHAVATLLACGLSDQQQRDLEQQLEQQQRDLEQQQRVAKLARCPGCGATISPDGILCDRCHERGAGHDHNGGKLYERLARANERSIEAQLVTGHDHGGPLGAGTCPVCNPCDDTEPDPDFLDLARAFGD